MLKKYKIKPIEVWAIQWNDSAETHQEIIVAGAKTRLSGGRLELYITVAEVWLTVRVGDWVVKDPLGWNLYRNESFLKSYNEVMEEPDMIVEAGRLTCESIHHVRINGHLIGFRCTKRRGHYSPQHVNGDRHWVQEVVPDKPVAHYRTVEDEYGIRGEKMAIAGNPQCRYGGNVNGACFNIAACGCQVIPDSVEIIVREYEAWLEQRMENGLGWGDDVDSDSYAIDFLERLRKVQEKETPKDVYYTDSRGHVTKWNPLARIRR